MPLLRTLVGIGLFLGSHLGFTAPPETRSSSSSIGSLLFRIYELGTDGDYVSQRSWMNDGITYEKWTVDGKADSPFALATPSYNETFAPALDNKTIEKYAEIRRQSGRTTHVADIMGSAVFSEEPHLFDSLTGVRLRPLHPGAYPEGYPCSHWKEVTGNVYLPSTWEDVDSAMPKSKFDIILARPEGFMTRLSRRYVSCASHVVEEQFFAIHFRLISRAWDRLTSDDGVMIVQLSSEVAEHTKFKQWISSLNRSGIDAKVFLDGKGLRGPCPILRLNKNALSLEKLPHTSH